MLRRTVYGVWVHDDGIGDIPDETEQAVLYLIECAELVGIEVSETTVLDFKFIANVLKGLRDKIDGIIRTEENTYT